VLKEFAADDLDPAMPLIEVAFACHRRGALREAEALYRQLLDADPNDLNALQLLGALLLDTGRAAEAVGTLQRAMDTLQARGSAAAEHAALYCNLATAQKASGRPDDAILTYRQGIALAPETLALHERLAADLIALDRPAEAIAPLQRIAAATPHDPAKHSDLGRAQFLAGEHGEARASLLRVLTLRPDDRGARLLIARIDTATGDLGAAEAGYREAIARQPNDAEALFALGLLLQNNLARPMEAIALYERLVAIQPRHVDAHAALGIARLRLMQIDRALEAFQNHLQLAPASAAAHFHVGRTLSLTGRDREALPFLERATRLDVACTLGHSAHMIYGVALQRLGMVAESQTEFRNALARKPVVTLNSGGEARTFSALFLMAPGLHNTPYEFLIHQASYDAHFLFLVPDFSYETDLLREQADVVVNLVSDAEQDAAILPVAASLVARLDKPTINHPARIASTGRESMAARLSTIPGCRIAHIRSHSASTLLSSGFLARADTPPLPLLVRRAGCHNGDAFELIGSETDLQRLVADDHAATYYLIEYIDYASPDGFFRKYRFFFVGEHILPYHLAISRTWKSHHVTTDMAKHAWMQKEEAAFLRAPHTVFDAARMQTMGAIRDAVGLEFFGIDCAVDRSGKIVVFEANATMLVNGENPAFPYMDRYARRIKTAFNAMLGRRASPSIEKPPA
jgi:tetratricopeptide (TPR) repeat protein